MKKLLAMYICVSAFLYGFDTKASGLDMPPLDNSHTQFSLVPESVFDNSSSYQIARTYFMPDYQRNLVGKQFGGRVNDGGSSGGDRSCSTYGLLSSCPPHSIGKGTKHPVAGLTCYEECVCDETYYKYSSLNCRAPKFLGSERCVKKTTSSISWVSASITLSSSCDCSSIYSLTSDTYNAYVTKDTATCTTCSDDRGTHYSCSCSSDYKYSSALANADCKPCTVTPARVPEETYKYKCTCKSGYTLVNNECVSQCDGYPLTVCPTGGICSQCPTDSRKLKLDSCDANEGWERSGNTCPPMACPDTYTAGVTSCSEAQNVLKTKGKSGGRTCGRCDCVYKRCLEDYGFNLSAADLNTKVGIYSSCEQGCGYRTLYKLTGCTENYKLVNGSCKYDVCTSGYSKTACSSNQVEADRTTTIAGSTCYKCDAKPAASCEAAGAGYQSAPPTKGQLCTEVKVGNLTCYKDCKCRYIKKGSTKYPLEEGIVTGYVDINREYISGMKFSDAKYCKLVIVDGEIVSWDENGDELPVPIQSFIKLESSDCSSKNKGTYICNYNGSNGQYFSSLNTLPINGGKIHFDLYNNKLVYPGGEISKLTVIPADEYVLICSSSSDFQIDCAFTGFYEDALTGDILQDLIIGRIGGTCSQWYAEGQPEEEICKTLIKTDEKGCQYLEDNLTVNDGDICKIISPACYQQFP